MQTRLKLAVRAGAGCVLASGESVRAAIAKKWVHLPLGGAGATRGIKGKVAAAGGSQGTPATAGGSDSTAGTPAGGQEGAARLHMRLPQDEWTGQLLPDLYDKYCM